MDALPMSKMTILLRSPGEQNGVASEVSIARIVRNLLSINDAALRMAKTMPQVVMMSGIQQSEFVFKFFRRSSSQLQVIHVLSS
jgi:hypothetical protein